MENERIFNRFWYFSLCWEPCRRHCGEDLLTLKSPCLLHLYSGLEQAACSMNSHCRGTCWHAQCQCVCCYSSAEGTSQPVRKLWQLNSSWYSLWLFIRLRAEESVQIKSCMKWFWLGGCCTSRNLIHIAADLRTVLDHLSSVASGCWYLLKHLGCRTNPVCSSWEKSMQAAPACCYNYSTYITSPLSRSAVRSLFWEHPLWLERFACKEITLIAQRIRRKTSLLGQPATDFNLWFLWWYQQVPSIGRDTRFIPIVFSRRQIRKMKISYPYIVKKVILLNYLLLAHLSHTAPQCPRLRTLTQYFCKATNKKNKENLEI